MSLNIKNEEAVRLAREVAGRTGESLTDAIRIALQERLERLDLEAPDDRRRRLEQLMLELRTALGPYRDGMTTDDLYDDETGLPR